ncbi:hypothetical protein SZ55_1712 [Pseudomonas sp. FeS53a]|nr:hypothetical protein SZ55_1712 [Pseudomonas sp. FeS53a]
MYRTGRYHENRACRCCHERHRPAGTVRMSRPPTVCPEQKRHTP